MSAMENATKNAGEMISWFRAETVSPTSPEYETNRDFLWANWEVRSDRRRQGIGSSWLPVVLELMDHHGCRTLTLEAEEESGHAFLRWLGAEAKSAGAENRLKLADVDWAMVKKTGRQAERLLALCHGYALFLAAAASVASNTFG